MVLSKQPSLPPVGVIVSLSSADRAAILDALFEPSAALHALSLDLLRDRQFDSYRHLVEAVGVQLTNLLESSSASDIEQLDGILGAHPRLGAAKVESAQSQAEQAQLQAASEEEARQLATLNKQYEETFPGLIYVVFVNGRARAVIMEDMRARIARGDIRAERIEAIKAMCDIAADRARKLA